MTRNFVTPDVMAGVTYSAGIGLSAVTSKMERVMGIEPTLSAWEAEVLPLNYTRAGRRQARLSPAVKSAQSGLTCMGERFVTHSNDSCEIHHNFPQ